MQHNWGCYLIRLAMPDVMSAEWQRHTLQQRAQADRVGHRAHWSGTFSESVGEPVTPRIPSPARSPWKRPESGRSWTDPRSRWRAIYSGL